MAGAKKRGGGGEKEGWSRVFKFLNSPERPEQGELSSFIHLLIHSPTVWALDPRILPVKVTSGLVCIKQNVLDACISTTWGSGRGLCPAIPDILGPKWNSPIGLLRFHMA